MTRPTSRLEWSADPLNPHAINALWWGAGWHYVLEWGHLNTDGTPAKDRVLFWQVVPVRHVYPRPGKYTLVGRPELTNGVPRSAEVTIRDTLRPEATFELLADGRSVRATLQHLDDDVRYQIIWGDNVITHHDVHDLAPVHEYPWGFGKPAITVIDLPALRGAKFTGPEIKPEPGPRAVDGFYFEHLSTTDASRRFALHGGGLKAGETITWYPWHSGWSREATADSNGQIHDAIDVEIPHWADWDVWRSYTVALPDGRRVHVPLHAPRAAAGEPDVTYQIHVDGNPKRVEVSATPAMLGKHQVDFGDGTNTSVDVTALPLRAPHTYRGSGPYTVRVTLPDARTATGTVRATRPCPPCYNDHYPGRCAIDWWITGNWCGACGGDSDAYAPVMIDNGFHAPHQLHKTCEGSPWHTGYGYGGFPAGTYYFQYRTALESAATHEITIARPAKITRAGGPWIEEHEVADDVPVLTGQFGNVQEWDGGYSGEFTVTNHGPEPLTWALEFALADPAVLREVWPSSARYTDLGGGRWRVWSDRPLGEKPVVVGARIEPPGKTKKFPDQITARPWTKEK